MSNSASRLGSLGANTVVQYDRCGMAATGPDTRGLAGCHTSAALVIHQYHRSTSYALKVTPCYTSSARLLG